MIDHGMIFILRLPQRLKFIWSITAILVISTAMRGNKIWIQNDDNPNCPQSHFLKYPTRKWLAMMLSFARRAWNSTNIIHDADGWVRWWMNNELATIIAHRFLLKRMATQSTRQRMSFFEWNGRKKEASKVSELWISPQSNATIKRQQSDTIHETNDE